MRILFDFGKSQCHFNALCAHFLQERYCEEGLFRYILAIRLCKYICPVKAWGVRISAKNSAVASYADSQEKRSTKHLCSKKWRDVKQNAQNKAYFLICVGATQRFPSRAALRLKETVLGNGAGRSLCQGRPETHRHAVDLQSRFAEG